MQQDKTYRLLIKLLTEYSSLPAGQLLTIADQPARNHEVADADGPTFITVDVERHLNHSVRITAIARGSSCWRLERIEEFLVVPIDD